MAENLLTVQNLHKSWGNKILFDQITFGVDKGQKLALLGINGSGKSTLLKIIAGMESDYVGLLTRRKDCIIHYLPQEAVVKPNPSKPGEMQNGLAVIEHLFSAQGQLGKILAAYYHELKNENTPESQTHRRDLEKQIDSFHGWELYQDALSLAGQLEIDLDWILEPKLSGGQLKKIQLVQALIGNPDLLILDEPTNHLDEKSIRWLEDQLLQFPGTLIVITHDRYFLERVVDFILELWQGKVQAYPGNYTRYLEKKAELEIALAKQDAKRLSFLRNEIDWIRRGPKARGTKAKARIERFEDAKGQAGFSRDKALSLNIGPGERLGKTILTLDKVCKSFGSQLLCRDLELDLLPGDRIGILGPNGCGKSTLLKMILNRVEPDAGTVKLGINTQIAYFDQKRADLNPDITVWQSLEGEAEYLNFGGQKVPKRTFLENFLFPPSLQHVRVDRLSGGEQNRLQLAQALLTPANLLLLDEPTNDLDIQSLQVLEETLVQYPGCILLVTHDRYFLDRVANSILVFEGEGKMRLHPGNYSDYLEWQKTQKQLQIANSKPTAPANTKTNAKVDKAESQETPKKKLGLTFQEKNEFSGMEKFIGLREEAMRIAEVALNEISANGDFQGIQKASQEFSKLQAEVEGLYERWAFLEEKNKG